MRAMKKLAEEFILEAEETGIDVKELLSDFSKDWDIDVTNLYSVVQDLKEEDVRRCEKIDKLML